MVKQSPHTRWKGCPICNPHKDTRHGDAYRILGKHSTLRAFGGRTRRLSRKDVPDQEEW